MHCKILDTSDATMDSEGVPNVRIVVATNAGSAKTKISVPAATNVALTIDWAFSCTDTSLIPRAASIARRGAHHQMTIAANAGPSNDITARTENGMPSSLGVDITTKTAASARYTSACEAVKTANTRSASVIRSCDFISLTSNAGLGGGAAVRLE